jgi:hypothetical protein
MTPLERDDVIYLEKYCTTNQVILLNAMCRTNEEPKIEKFTSVWFKLAPELQMQYLRSAVIESVCACPYVSREIINLLTKPPEPTPLPQTYWAEN